MKDFVLKLVLKYLGGAKIKALLDMLPLRGRLTVISAAITAVCVLQLAFANGVFGQLLTVAHNVLNDAGAAPIWNAADIGALLGAVMTVIGLLRKALSKLDELSRYRGLS